MKNIILFLTFSLLFLITACAQSPTSSEMVFLKEAPSSFLESFQTEDDAYLIDCRTPEEFVQGNIKGAVNIDFFNASFEKNLTKLDTTKPVYVYCKSGGRSGKAANLLKKIGFDKIVDMKGGYSAYKAQNQ